MIERIVFSVALLAGIGLFVKNLKTLTATIKLGKPFSYKADTRKRFKNMITIALGQQKMVSRPLSGVLHLFVYIGFVVINIEVLEIVIDGIFGTHRIFSFLGAFYSILIGAFEVLSLLVILAVALFWVRRNILRISRFRKPELKGWPKKDANIILYFEALLMLFFLTMNATDHTLQNMGASHYVRAGAFPISGFLAPLFQGFTEHSLILVERVCWWAHILGIIVFLNYLYYSKHLHILLAFPNVFFAEPGLKGAWGNLPAVTVEVKTLLGIDDASITKEPDTANAKFGASDVTDLYRYQLLAAYTCTECGRCTDECPANKTGKLLSPRKIMMNVRDRLEHYNKEPDKTLFDDISTEEIWACTSCNACAEACPVSINPMSIIMSMRQYLVMEKASAPAPINTMMTNIENNGAPWPYNQMDRLNWSSEL